jgi:hypothetical protein
MAANKPNAFAADIRGLDRRAILQDGQQRQHGTLGKIGMLEQAPGVADHVAKREIDWLQMGIQPPATFGLQRASNRLLRRSWSVCTLVMAAYRFRSAACIILTTGMSMGARGIGSGTSHSFCGRV